MKKIFGVFVILFMMFMVVGCGKTESTDNETSDETKKDVIISCSKGTEADINFTTEMSYYFENNVLVNLGVKYVYDLSKYSEEQRKAFEGSKMCETESFETKMGMKDCKEELVGTNYVVNGYATKLLEQSKGTSKDIKSSYEADGWTCIEK